MTIMNSMFHAAKVFNRDLFYWNVARVTDMQVMFQETEEFDQDLRNWNVRKVSTFSNMFNQASKFNADVSQWDLISATAMENMFEKAISFDRTLCGEKWSSLNAIPTHGRSGCCNAGSYMVNPHLDPFSATDGAGACNTYNSLSIHDLGKNPFVLIVLVLFLHPGC